MTAEEEIKLLNEEYLLGVEDMDPAEEELLYRLAHKKRRAHYLSIRNAKAQSVKTDLQRRKEMVAAQERKEANALLRYKEKENFYVYCTMVELNDELSRTHTSGRPLYTTAMKVEIVEKQIQYRRDCLMRKLRPGTLCSDAKINDDRKLDRLKENFKQILIDEALYPSLKQPPQIRATYEAHVFPNKVRRDLDSERNAVTREMTRHFLETFEGGVFTGWRCSYDYALSRPLNPNALTGQRVTKIFESKEFLGTVAFFKKWWHVVFDDGDEEDLNYRQLSQLKTPPNFDVLQYAAPDVAAADFRKKTGHDGKIAVKLEKNGKVEEFTLENQQWVLISVFMLQDCKRPLQGAYIEEDDFAHGMRRMELAELLAKHPDVRLSPMEDIRYWIEASTKGKSRPRQT